MKNKVYSLKNICLRSFLPAACFLIMVLCIAPLSKADEEDIDKTGIQNNIFNIHGSEMGRVSETGEIYSKYGRQVGSVDKNGTIFNVSDLEIGKVMPGGNVVNQSGTRLGSVNKKGEIFNVSNRKIGEVRDISDLFLAGGAARLIFLK